MKKAKDVMIPLRKVITADPEESLQNVMKKMAKAGVSGVPVIATPGKKVVGVISESDILRFVEKDEAEMGGEKAMVNLEHALPTRVRELMSKSLVTVGPEAGLDEVVRLMTTKKVNRVVVVDKKRSLLGLVARAEALHAALEAD